MSSSRRKTGRPPRAGKISTVRIAFDVTPDEHTRLLRAAHGEPIAAWARRAAFVAAGIVEVVRG